MNISKIKQSKFSCTVALVLVALIACFAIAGFAVQSAQANSFMWLTFDTGNHSVNNSDANADNFIENNSNNNEFATNDFSASKLSDDAPEQTYQSVYRLYNTITSEHLFTTSEEEYNTLKQEYDTNREGWQGEGECWKSPTTSEKGVYRIYNDGLAKAGKMGHHYTTDKHEADTRVRENGWQYDNDGQPLFYSAEDENGSVMGGASGVYRLYNDGLSAHHFTLAKNEHDDLVDKYGWVDEKAGFYAYGVKSLDFSKISLESNTYTYTASQIKPNVVSNEYKIDNDYTVEYGENLNAGKGSVTVRGVGEYRGEQTYTFDIVKAPLTITGLTAEDKPYDGNTDVDLNTENAELSGVCGKDNITIQSITGTFADAELGNDKEISLRVMFEGDDLTSNYEFTVPTVKASILAVVKFVTNCSSTLENQNVKVGTAIKNPASALASREGLSVQGWYTDEVCSTDATWNIEDGVTQNMTLYANWTPSEGASATPYFLGHSKTIMATSTEGATNTTSNEKYVSAVWNVKKSAAEIQSDLQKIKNGDATVKTEYAGYMNNDDYHLYTKWNGSAEDAAGENAYIEFRIIEVGEHASDKSTLTFQATHVLPVAYQMNGSATNNGGWAGSALHTSLNSSEGAIYSKLDSAFTSAVKRVEKKTNAGNESTELATSTDAFWIASLVELAGTTPASYANEGTQYAFYANKNIKVSGINSALVMKTRAGNTAAGSTTTKSVWWVRSPRTQDSRSFNYVSDAGIPSSVYSAEQSLGVTLCFCF